MLVLYKDFREETAGSYRWHQDWCKQGDAEYYRRAPPKTYEWVGNCLYDPHPSPSVMMATNSIERFLAQQSRPEDMPSKIRHETLQLSSKLATPMKQIVS